MIEETYPAKFRNFITTTSNQTTLNFRAAQAAHGASSAMTFAQVRRTPGSAGMPAQGIPADAVLRRRPSA